MERNVFKAAPLPQDRTFGPVTQVPDVWEKEASPKDVDEHGNWVMEGIVRSGSRHFIPVSVRRGCVNYALCSLCSVH